MRHPTGRQLSPFPAARSLALLLLLQAAAIQAWGHSRPMSAEEMVMESDAIVVATIASATPRWNEQHTLIVTEYKLAVEDRLKGASGAVETVIMPGGSLDGELHEVCTSVHFEVGGRYLLFLHPAGGKSLTSVTGSGQGAFREVAASNGNRQAQPLQPGASSAAQPIADFDAFLAGLRILIRQTEENPPVLRRGGSLALSRPLPGKTYQPGSGKSKSITTAVLPQERPAAGLAPEPPSEPILDAPAGNAELLLRSKLDPSVDSSRYRIDGAPPLPIVFNPFPLDWGWSPHDQQMMSTWNAYAGSVFLVTSPTGNWAFRNDRNDLVGWVDSATLLANFGEGWNPGDLAVCFNRKNSSGMIIESDIALNSDVQWTLDNEVGTRVDNGVWSFEQTMLHELGHAFGLRHPWQYQDVWWDSVMNYAPKYARTPVLFADDVNAIRAVYPGNLLHDGLLSCYSTGDMASNNNPSYTAATAPYGHTVNKGASFNTGGSFKIENCGTDPIYNPQVEVYLCPTRMSWDGAVYTKTLDLTGNTLPTFHTLYFSVGEITVPASTAAGKYHVGIYLRDGQDALPYNNAAWMNNDEFISVIKSCIGDVFEPNDSFAEAPILTPTEQGFTFPGFSACRGDEDFFEVYILPGAELWAQLLYDADSSELALSIWGPDHRRVASQNPANGMATALITGPGPWYLLVETDGASIETPYSLKLQASSACMASRPPFQDCNQNGIQDLCDLEYGISTDLDGSGYPDECEVRAPSFRRGDVDGDGSLSISDSIGILTYLFIDGRQPGCLETADFDNDGEIIISDPVQLLGFLFLRNAAPPAAPGHASCGPDPDAEGSAGALGCESYSCSAG